MKIIADLHLHSHYARATSRELNISNLEKYARIKGVNLLGTGDFQHPKWQQEVRNGLQEDDSGILRTKSGFPFIWQTEISLVYTQGGKGRRVHFVILAPSGEIVSQVTEALAKKGRLDYDGRPIFGFSSVELVEMLVSISRDIEIIPAHAWTPWFSVFGSNSGFDSLKECFQEKSNFIHAIETGLSSDPPMNWRLSELDSITLLSNSDSHSFWPWRMGREANIFDLKELSYRSIVSAIRSRNLVATVEVDPSYGKYHFDGHRSCGVCLSPSESIKNKDICPKCKRKLTIGVLHRVEELADRPDGFRPKDAVPFHSIIPLSEIIAGVSSWPVASTKTWKVFNDLLAKFKDEFTILLDADEQQLAKVADEKLVKALLDNRAGKLKILPGFDGEYGKPVFGGRAVSLESESPGKPPVDVPAFKRSAGQKGLGDFF